VKNQDGECVCDVSRGYYRIHEGICNLAQIPCTPAGSQLSLNGNTYKETHSIYAYYDWLSVLILKGLF
jgi:hypothetical protein